MGVAWLDLLRAVPALRGAIARIGESKDWYSSDSIVYQILKVTSTILTALGIVTYSAISDADIKKISIELAVIIPSVLTLFDGLTAIWLRLRTNTAIKGTALAKQVEESTVTLPITGNIGTTAMEIRSEVAALVDPTNPVERIVLVKAEPCAPVAPVGTG